MKTSSHSTQAVSHTERVWAEAASWVARLQGPDRSPRLERGFRKWLAESPAHAVAFERATDVWQKTADLPGELRERPIWKRPSPSRWMSLAAAASLAFVVCLGLLYYNGRDLVRTKQGEQRTVILQDGSRVELNTNSKIIVHYADHERKVELAAGEAYFDVAKVKDRPFIVTAGENRILALGTSFVVRRDHDRTSVTLMEGKVAVSTASVLVKPLSPGQRLTLAKAASPKVDQPSMANVTAWQRGQLIFEETPLSDAIAEFNRYGPTRVRIDSPGIANIPVGGVFRIGSFTDFLRAVADTHQLQILDTGADIQLVERVPTISR